MRLNESGFVHGAKLVAVLSSQPIARKMAIGTEWRFMGRRFLILSMAERHEKQIFGSSGALWQVSIIYAYRLFKNAINSKSLKMGIWVLQGVYG